MFKREYLYFVSFRMNKGDREGFGNCDLECPKIKSIDDIREIEEAISRKNGYDKTILLNFKRL